MTGTTAAGTGPAGPATEPDGLLLLLTGPLQSWGERSLYGDRDTAAWPTLSGITGLFASALGMSRNDDLGLFGSFVVTVRADRPGVPLVDFQTAGTADPGGIAKASGKRGGEDRTVVGHRHYLADAAFVVAVDLPAGQTMSSPAASTLDRVAVALARPRWAPYLGRRGCPPGYPVLLGRTAGPAAPHLDTIPVLAAGARDGQPGKTVTVIRETDDPTRTATVSNDRPAGFGSRTRSYTPRRLEHDTTRPPAAGTGLTGYRTLLEAARAAGNHTRPQDTP